jgi:monofunctional biosynthetic peptidoglycan transglycosylase
MAKPSTDRKKKSAAPPKSKPARPRWFRIVWLSLVVIALGLLVPVLEVGCVKVMNPPVTTLMLVRQAEAKLGGDFKGGMRYEWRAWDQLPEIFLRCVWVSEDGRFFRHHGFDWIEMQAALARAQRTGGDPRGSSTITMQCARSTFLWTGRSYLRKGLEAYYTLLMEAMLSKRRIFELYANVIEMGDGVYGVEAASRAHFGIPSSSLNTAQSALLAAMLPNPRRWNPREPSRRLRWRQLHIMRELEREPPVWPVGLRK